MRIVLGIGGGIAAYKAAMLLRLFSEAGHEVVAMPTPTALRFVGADTWEALSGHPVSTSVHERVDEVNHVRQAEAADLLVIAPATADLLSRLATGRADDLLAATVLTATCPVLLAPAMHTQMWQNPATQENVETLRRRGHTVLEPAVGRLTGTDSGAGRLPEPEQIRDAALAVAAGQDASPDLTGRTLLVSAGGTREALDPVRYLGNRSSGKQGLAVAVAAARAGAQVCLVAAHLEVPLSQGVPGLSVRQVSSALELKEAMEQERSRLAPDAIVMTAAVADFRPARTEQTKIKKDPATTGAPSLELVRNPDVLHGLVQSRNQQGTGELIVGFAAETGSAEATVAELGRQKLARKGCDVLVLNQVGTDKVFGKDTTEATILVAARESSAEACPSEEMVSGTKQHLAARLLAVLADLLPAT